MIAVPGTWVVDLLEVPEDALLMVPEVRSDTLVRLILSEWVLIVAPDTEIVDVLKIPEETLLIGLLVRSVLVTLALLKVA